MDYVINMQFPHGIENLTEINKRFLAAKEFILLVN